MSDLTGNPVSRPRAFQDVTYEPKVRHGNLKIDAPFEKALKAATDVPADKLAKPQGKPAKKRTKH